MRRVDPPPTIFGDFKRIGGVVDFALFDDAGPGKRDAADAVAATIAGHGYQVDHSRLLTLGSRQINARDFFGDWMDDRDRLLMRGQWTTKAGAILQDPAYLELDGVEFASGGWNSPEPGSGGQFAYAFTNPPHRLHLPPSKVQILFDQLRQIILPNHSSHIIRDWSSSALPDVSAYFADGMEWWGVFLFSIYTAETRRLAIIMASTTD